MTIVERLEKLGFAESDTGGGFQAYALIQGEIEILVTSECDLPEEGQSIQVGWYKDGNQVRSITLNPPYTDLEKLVAA